MSDTIDWVFVDLIDKWLDEKAGIAYQAHPLGQDWARVAKVGEELGEAISELILATGQNPRKGIDPEAGQRLLDELADTAFTAIFAIQHFTKDPYRTREILQHKLRTIYQRMAKGAA